MDLSVFFDMPFPIEAMSPKWTCVRVSLMISFAVRTFERIRTWFALLGFQSRRVKFSITLTTSTKLSMVFRLMWSVAFDALCPLYPAQKSQMSPLPAVFALGDSRVHVCSSNSSNVVADVEAPINEYFSIMTALNIPYINPDDCHVGLRRNFDYSWLRC